MLSAQMLNNKGDMKQTLSHTLPDVDVFRLPELCFDCRFLICIHMYQQNNQCVRTPSYFNMIHIIS